MNETIGAIRVTKGPVDIDLEKRILRRVVVLTTGVASDGWIILPAGADLKRFLESPIVTARHIAQPDDAMMMPEAEPIVIGRTLAMQVGALEIATEVQFADTKLGREYAYLYGVNNGGENGAPEVYMRAWSVEGPVLEKGAVSWADAEKLAGPYWDANVALRLQARKVKAVQVATRFEMTNFAAVALGADRGALTRAWGAGIATAGAVISRMDLAAAMRELAGHKATVGELSATVARLEGHIQALRGEGASAAARGDSEAVLEEVRALRQMLAPESK
jgi:hypothetical protein